jgi:hypothetical protein
VNLGIIHGRFVAGSGLQVLGVCRTCGISGGSYAETLFGCLDPKFWIEKSYLFEVLNKV